MNESIYYNADQLNQAINTNIKIAFQYTQWILDKKVKPKNGGALYHVSPWALMWDNEYLPGIDVYYDDLPCSIGCHFGTELDGIGILRRQS